MRSELDVKITSGLGIAFFVGIAIFKGPRFSEELVSVASSAVTATVIARFFFVKWIWKWMPHFVCGVPLLEGEWEGKLESTGNERTPDERKEVKVTVSVVQPDMFSVRVVRGSDESKSSSFGECLKKETDGTVELLYSYRSEPNAMVRERSPISYGTARLRTSTTKLDELAGDYWTDQKTTGHIKLSRKK